MSTRQLHPDFGPPPYGIPYVVVAGDQARVPVTFDYSDESDAGVPGLPGYPIPEEAKTQPHFIEGDVPGGGSSGDRHLLLIDRDRWLLYEVYATQWNATAGRWEAGSGAIFDLSTNARRPDTWTSADAAGLAISPGPRALRRCVWRRRDHARVPLLDARDQRLRLAGIASRGIDDGRAADGHAHADESLEGYLRLPPEMQKIFRAMKRYGLILADNGSDMYISGTMDARWNNSVLNPAFHSLTADDFEVVQLGWGRGTPPAPPTGLRIVR